MSANSLAIPIATYRLQLSGLSFERARELVPYLAELGIGAAYLSPFFRARKGSTHGYDVVDHAMFDPTLGDEQKFSALADALREAGLGLLVDIVPNHMGIDDPHNGWWQDVLENGPASPYAAYFDIDWSPPKEGLRGKVLLPVLGDQFGRVLEDQQLKLAYENSRFVIGYYERRLPTDPATWVQVLQAYAGVSWPRNWRPKSPNGWSWRASSRLSNICRPAMLPIRMRFRSGDREKEVAAGRLERLLESCPEVQRGRRTHDRRLQRQAGGTRQLRPARRSSWPINRIGCATGASPPTRSTTVASSTSTSSPRFAWKIPKCSRPSTPRFWNSSRKDRVTGLRIDHADGLLDPQQYLANLAEATGRALDESTSRAASCTSIPSSKRSWRTTKSCPAIGSRTAPRATTS